MDFRTLTSLTIPEGVVTKITDTLGNVLWRKNVGLPNYVKFSSDKPFTITFGRSQTSYDGTIYVTNDPNNENWNAHTSATVSYPAAEVNSGYALYFRGSGNTHLTISNGTAYPWELTAESDVYCSGNLESLLDYESVEAGIHPTVAEGCCYNMFYNWTNLVSAPVLPSPTLAARCYLGMFVGCTSLATAPALPATTLAANCYQSMFTGCTSLIMPPALPATTLATNCYVYMFQGCTSLIGLPALPSTTLGQYCYRYMFHNCTSIKLSATQTDDYSLEYRIPSSGSVTSTLMSVTATATANMFGGTGGSFTGTPSLETTYYLDASNSIVSADYLTFASTDTFSISVGTPSWDGTMEYSTDLYSWNTWDGSEISGTALYLRGSGNTMVTGSTDTSYKWTLTGSNIACVGNIETLLDYKTVTSGEHPSMTEKCYSVMFYNCTALTTAPIVPATTLATGCYYGMFYNCTNLTTVPSLPATTLAANCYQYMFSGCTTLTTAPALPATTLATGCYYGMFGNCTSLATAPELPATTLATHCYRQMFYGCTALTQAPALPATAAAQYCYYGMFQGCTALTTAPALPAMVLQTYCYYRMFYGCTALTTIPALPATTLKVYCYNQMFYNCSSIKISSNSYIDGYEQEYRIPTSGTGTTATNAMTNMFYGTTAVSGPVTTPTINTTYALHTDCSIVS